MKQNLDDALARLLAHEGGYTNHPSDPGGPTNFGITIHDYRKYIQTTATAADVRAMSLDDAKRIYRIRYWDAQRCDDLPSGVDYAIFDYGVNSGIGRSGKVLRRLVGMADNTHAVNVAVIEAVRKRDPVKLVNAICDERLAFLKRLKTWPVFGKGWGRRVDEVRTRALHLAGQSTGSTPASPASGKGAVPVQTGKQTAIAGGIVATGAAVAQQAHASGTAPAVVIAILVVAAAVAAAAWIWWRRRQTHMQEN
jgi:lysozyme family protein